MRKNCQNIIFRHIWKFDSKCFKYFDVSETDCDVVNKRESVTMFF